MKVSDLFISNPIASIQDTDLMYLSVDDGGGGWDSGACTFLSLKNNIPTLYTADGTLLADRTIDMDGNIALWEGGQVAIGAPGTAFDDVLAMLQVFPNGERPAFAIGSFAGVQAQAGVLSLEQGDFIGGYLAGSDITVASNLRFQLGVDGADGEYALVLHNLNGDQVVKLIATPGENRFEIYEDLGNLIFEIDGTAGACTIGSGTPASFAVYGNIGFNKAPQVPLTTTAETAGGAYTANEQDMLQQLWDMAFHYGLFNL